MGRKRLIAVLMICVMFMGCLRSVKSQAAAEAVVYSSFEVLEWLFSLGNSFYVPPEYMNGATQFAQLAESPATVSLLNQIGTFYENSAKDPITGVLPVPTWEGVVSDLRAGKAVADDVYKAICAGYSDFYESVVSKACDYSMPMEFVTNYGESYFDYIDSLPDGQKVATVFVPGIGWFSATGDNLAFLTKSPGRLSRSTFMVQIWAHNSGEYYFARYLSEYDTGAATLSNDLSRHWVGEYLWWNNATPEYILSGDIPVFDNTTGLYAYLDGGDDSAAIGHVSPGVPDVLTPSGAPALGADLPALDVPALAPDVPQLDIIKELLDKVVVPSQTGAGEAVAGYDLVLDNDLIAELILEYLDSLVNENTGVYPGTGEGEGEGGDNPSIDVSGNADYATPGLDTVFPFCIPFDLVDCFKLFSADAKAPRFEFPLISKQFGLNETVVVDLAPFEPVAVIFRTLEIIAFIVALIMITRNLIGS